MNGLCLGNPSTPAQHECMSLSVWKVLEPLSISVLFISLSIHFNQFCILLEEGKEDSKISAKDVIRLGRSNRRLWRQSR